MTFAEKIQRIFAESGRSQNSCIRAIGQWPKTYDRWIKEGHNPTVKDIRNICREFGTDANWLIDDDQEWDEQPGKLWKAHKMARVLAKIEQLGWDETLNRIERPTEIGTKPIAEKPLTPGKPRGGPARKSS